MKKIFWLASYPKSGNTWMRVFLTNYLRNGDFPADINQLDTDPISSARPIFDKYVGVSASELSFEMVDRYRPELYRIYAQEQPQEQLFMKVHDAYHLNEDNEPVFPEDISKGVIYIIRNPLGVAVSFAHHNHSPLSITIKNMNDSGFAFCPRNDRLQNQLRQKMGSWSDHFRSWVSQEKIPVIVVKYEDMLLNPNKTFGKVVQFCDLPYEEERLNKAIRYSSFEELKKQEMQHGFNEKNPKAESFFRNGKIGSWREKITSEMEQELVLTHHDTMQKMGYLPGVVDNGS